MIAAVSPAWAETIPHKWRQQPGWAVWRTERPDGQLFEERRLYRPFKEHPGTRSPSGASSVDIRRCDEEGADFALALTYLDFRAGEFEGLAYLRHDGGVEYFPSGTEGAP